MPQNEGKPINMLSTPVYSFVFILCAPPVIIILLIYVCFLSDLRCLGVPEGPWYGPNRPGQEGR